MGHIKHDAVIFTTWDRKAARKLHTEARRLFGTKQVTALAPSPINGFNTFVIMPHGSKDGWAEKSHWQSSLKMLFEFIGDTFTDLDGDTPFDWVHVNFGGDDEELKAETTNLTISGSF